MLHLDTEMFEVLLLLYIYSMYIVSFCCSITSFLYLFIQYQCKTERSLLKALQCSFLPLPFRLSFFSASSLINLYDECALGYYIRRSLFPACSLARFLLMKSVRVFLGGALASSGLSAKTRLGLTDRLVEEL